VITPSGRLARVRRLGLLAPVTVLVAGLLCGADWTGAAPSPVLARLTSETAVKPCAGHPGVRCGNIKVPLYWSAPHRGSLTVHFKEYLHTDSSTTMRRSAR
jgi:hypothetical protein